MSFHVPHDCRTVRDDCHRCQLGLDEVADQVAGQREYDRMNRLIDRADEELAKIPHDAPPLSSDAVNRKSILASRDRLTAERDQT